MNGDASVNKLARVASIATSENEEILAEQVKLLSKSALETLVRDEKLACHGENQNGLQKALFNPKSVPGHRLNFEIDDEIIQELNELNSKNINVNELLRTMLQQRKAEISQSQGRVPAKTKSTTSRYIPVKIKKILKQEHGNKCSIRTCQKPSGQIHHSQRFALAHTHDPKFMAPLCKEHHQIAHTIDQNYHTARRKYS